MDTVYGPNFRVIRKLHGQTLEAVAAKTGTSRSTLFRIERGEQDPPDGFIDAFCDAFFLKREILYRRLDVRLVDVTQI